VDGVEVRDLAVAFEDFCDAGELGFFLCHRIVRRLVSKNQATVVVFTNLVFFSTKSSQRLELYFSKVSFVLL
jgi:hypothetical protein